MKRAFCLVLLIVPLAHADKAKLEISATKDADSDRAVNARAATLRACFSKEKNRNPSLREHASLVVFHVSVKDGHAEVPVFDETASVKDDNVKSCVAITIKRVAFPKDAHELDYTLTYMP